MAEDGNHGNMKKTVHVNIVSIELQQQLAIFEHNIVHIFGCHKISIQQVYKRHSSSMLD